jgi:hypothetical protein
MHAVAVYDAFHQYIPQVVTNGRKRQGEEEHTATDFRPTFSRNPF